MRNRYILSLVFLIFSCVASSGAPQAPIPAKQLLAWVVGGMSVDQLKAQVESRGTAFQSDNSYLELLKSAGAAPEVLCLLSKAGKPAGVAAPAITADPAFQKLASAATALGAKNHEAALKALAAAVQIEPNDADLNFAMGGIFASMGDWERAAATYHQATHLSPDFLDAHLALAYACYRVQDADCAEAESKRVLMRSPDDAEAHKDLGLAYMVRDDNASAVREYREAIRLKPDYSNAYYDLGIALHDMKDMDGSIAAYQQAIKFDPNNSAQYYNMGISYADKGDHAHAIAAYRKAKTLNPKGLEIRQNLGSELCMSAEYAGAVKEFNELLAMDPEWNMARDGLGRSLIGIGHFDEAIAVYQEYLRRDPDDSYGVRVGYGRALEEKGKIREAQAEYEHAVREHPEAALTHRALGVFYYNHRQPLDAARELKEAVRLDPTDTEHMKLLAYDYEVLDQNDRAQPLLKQRIAVLTASKGAGSPDVAEAQADLAQFLGTQGKYEQSKPLFLEAIKTLEQLPAKSAELQTIRNNYKGILDQEGRAHAPAATPQPGTSPTAAPDMVKFALTSGPFYIVDGRPYPRDTSPQLLEDVRRAQAARFQRHLSESEQFLQQAVQEADKLPAGDPRQIDVLLRLGSVSEMEGHAEVAERAQKRALALMEKASGRDSPRVANLLESLVMGRMMKNDLKSAQAYAERALVIRERTAAKTDPILCSSMNLLASVYSAGKQYLQAEALYQRGLSLMTEAYGPDSVHLEVPLSGLGNFYLSTGQLEKAETQFRRILAVQEKAYGPDNPLLVGSLNQLSNELHKRGKVEEAAAIEKRRDAIVARQRQGR